MTQLPPAAGLAYDLLRIHKVLTRGLKVSFERGEEFQQAGFPTAALQKGYSIYMQSLIAVLEAHHLGEDEVAFPFLRKKVPAAPYSRLIRSHQEIKALLGSLQQACPPLEGPVPGLAALLEGLQKITSIWRPHIQSEEHYFSPEALAQAASPQEQAQVSAAFGRYSQEHASPAALVIPFVLFNLEGADRLAMAANMPPQVMQELVPVAWKEQWAPMRPFLLEI